ncbi:protein-glutamate O-methyltransferase CheR [Hydrogenivirga sp. 128-5-R1-1]|uniref:CheR family methyltransferase n=1 Tax=Hydrogenivirga sp. 128-5-R1-1 TaxID=392423 RepID=UPI00015F189B|nr:protein-glutamate O-methyltransferase CheR [Hydrogenivirga sp. 128-5-R1-1]EDP75402.1 aconitate hydratase [Hydrogenivirga sp. 128-5-R1-1]
MKAEQRQELVELLRKAIYELTGNYYPDERMKILEYKLERLLKSMNVNADTPEGIISFFLKTPENRKLLIDLMTVPETRFFREKEQLDVLFDNLLKGRYSLEIASVGCSTGQEPYTLAMMMAKRGIGGKVVGMDINEEVLKKARSGVYKASELKDIPEDYRRFVEVKGSLLEIKPDIKSRVEFHQINLIDPATFRPFLCRFDVVFCRNVLIYFSGDSKRRALTNLRSALKRDGYLVISSTEILNREYYDLFEPVKEGRFFFYKKRETGDDKSPCG